MTPEPEPETITTYRWADPARGKQRAFEPLFAYGPRPAMVKETWVKTGEAAV